MSIALYQQRNCKDMTSDLKCMASDVKTPVWELTEKELLTRIQEKNYQGRTYEDILKAPCITKIHTDSDIESTFVYPKQLHDRFSTKLGDDAWKASMAIIGPIAQLSLTFASKINAGPLFFGFHVRLMKDSEYFKKETVFKSSYIIGVCPLARQLQDMPDNMTFSMGDWKTTDLPDMQTVITTFDPYFSISNIRCEEKV